MSDWLTVGCHFLYGPVRDLWHKSKHGEYGESRKDTCPTVNDGNQNGISEEYYKYLNASIIS